MSERFKNPAQARDWLARQHLPTAPESGHSYGLRVWGAFDYLAANTEAPRQRAVREIAEAKVSPLIALAMLGTFADALIDDFMGQFAVAPEQPS